MPRFASLFLGLFLIVGMLGPVQAGSKEDKIRELLEASGATTTLSAIRTPMMAQIESLLDARFPNLKPAHRKEIIGALDEEFDASTPDLFALIIPAYAKMFSEKEIEDVLAFYKTPSGQAFARKSPELAVLSMQAGQEWGRLVGERAAKRIQEKAKELGYDI